MTKIKLMTHWVAGYPDYAQSLAAMQTLRRAGADYLEIQFPYSDPTADGPVIEQASQTALKNGFTVDQGFQLLAQIIAENSKLASASPPVFIMTYASLVFARGVDKFVADAAAIGVNGLVIPDLPVDCDENLFAYGAARNVSIVPVVAPGLSEQRFELIKSRQPQYVYAALRSGITGQETSLSAATCEFLRQISCFEAKIIAGFGIRTVEQMTALSEYVYAAAAGSVFLSAYNAAIAAGENPLTILETTCKALLSSNRQ